jgi:Ca2+-binding EF-hand superfamily protein
MKYGNQIAAVVADSMKGPNQDELEEQIFLKKFNEYDKQKTGSIPKEKLSEFILDLGIYIPDEEMPSLIEKLDSKGDGLIQFNKLQAWFKQVNAAANDLPSEVADNKSKGPKNRGKKNK